MRKPCQARGCGLPTSSQFARYCALHKARLRRQGDAEQRGICKKDIKPYVAMVRARIAKNSVNAAWSELDARWEALVRYSSSVLGASETGRAMSRHERQASQQIVALASSVEPRAVVETVLAIVIMLEMDPPVFRTDRAFRTQLVRRVLGLSPRRGHLRFSPGVGKMKRHYRELPPRTIAVLGQWLAETLGSPGLKLARLEMAERARAAETRQSFQNAVAEIE